MPRRTGSDIHGWLVLDKPGGLSSNAALVQARRLLGARKAGHAGTLDPLATGVLPIALGEATKTVPFAVDAEKTYSFSVRWGMSTDTLDAEGRATARSSRRAAASEIDAALAAMVGEFDQVPPRYSAIRVDGERACDRLRRGEQIEEPPPRPVHLIAARRTGGIGEGSDEETRFHVRCGKGFYVRSLARDLALALGLCGHVIALRRLAVGVFCEKDAKSLEMLAKTRHKDDARGYIQPVAAALERLPHCRVDHIQAAGLRCGRRVAWGTGSPPVDPREASLCAVFERDIPIALARPDPEGLVPVRVFNL